MWQDCCRRCCHPLPAWCQLSFFLTHCTRFGLTTHAGALFKVTTTPSVYKTHARLSSARTHQAVFACLSYKHTHGFCSFLTDCWASQEFQPPLFLFPLTARSCVALLAAAWGWQAVRCVLRLLCHAHSWCLLHFPSISFHPAHIITLSTAEVPSSAFQPECRTHNHTTNHTTEIDSNDPNQTTLCTLCCDRPDRKSVV